MRINIRNFYEEGEEEEMVDEYAGYNMRMMKTCIMKTKMASI